MPGATWTRVGSSQPLYSEGDDSLSEEADSQDLDQVDEEEDEESRYLVKLPSFCADSSCESGRVPSARAFHAACALTFHRLVLVFGGTDGSDLLGDTHAFSLQINEWVNHDNFLVRGCGEANAPPPRCRATLVALKSGRVGCLFGGVGGGSDVFLFEAVSVESVTKFRWLRPSVSGCPPRPRFAHAACALSADEMVVLGGTSAATGMVQAPLSDVFVFDLRTCTWFEIALESSSWSFHFQGQVSAFPLKASAADTWAVGFLVFGGSVDPATKKSFTATNSGVSAASVIHKTDMYKQVLVLDCLAAGGRHLRERSSKTLSKAKLRLVSPITAVWSWRPVLLEGEPVMLTPIKFRTEWCRELGGAGLMEETRVVFPGDAWFRSCFALGDHAYLLGGIARRDGSEPSSRTLWRFSTEKIVSAMIAQHMASTTSSTTLRSKWETVRALGRAGAFEDVPSSTVGASFSGISQETVFVFGGNPPTGFSPDFATGESAVSAPRLLTFPAPSSASEPAPLLECCVPLSRRATRASRRSDGGVQDCSPIGMSANFVLTQSLRRSSPGKRIRFDLRIEELKGLSLKKEALHLVDSLPESGRAVFMRWLPDASVGLTVEGQSGSFVTLSPQARRLKQHARQLGGEDEDESLFMNLPWPAARSECAIEVMPGSSDNLARSRGFEAPATQPTVVVDADLYRSSSPQSTWVPEESLVLEGVCREAAAFSGLNENKRAGLLSRFVAFEFAKGEVVCPRGGAAFYVVERGFVQEMAGGRVVEHYGPGQLIEPSGSHPTSSRFSKKKTTCICASDVAIVWRITRSEYEEFVSTEAKTKSATTLSMILTGGRSEAGSALNDVWLVTFASPHWMASWEKIWPPSEASELHASPDSLVGRYGHTLTALPGYSCAVIFGGKTEAATAELMVLDLEARAVAAPTVRGKSPPSRYGHAACATRGRCPRLVIGGGRSTADDRELKDLFVWEPTTGTWTEVNLPAGGWGWTPSSTLIGIDHDMVLLFGAQDYAKEADESLVDLPCISL